MLRLDYAEHSSGFQDPASDWLLAIIDLQTDPVPPHLDAESIMTELVESLLGVTIDASCRQYMN
jgi:hypothetical protein